MERTAEFPEKKEISVSDMMHVYGGFGCGVDYTVRLSVRLPDDIDEGMLENALYKTALRFPYLGVRLVRGESSFYYERDTRPARILKGGGRVELGGADTDGKCWSVSVDGSMLHLDIYHGLTDGAGMYALLAFLLQKYCAARYGIEDTDVTFGEARIAVETADPLEGVAPVYAEPGMLPEAFTLETDGGLTPCPATVWDIELPEEAFVAFSSANDASPGVMTALLLARSIAKLYPARGKDIIGAYVVNARPMLGAKNVLHNCLSMALLKYGERLASMPLSLQCGVFRGMTFVQSDADRVLSAMAANAGSVLRAAEACSSIEDKKRVFSEMFSAGEGRITYLVSYTGKWKHPETGALMREFWCHPPNTFSLMAEIGAAGGKLFISLQQRFKEDLVREEFLRQLDICRVPYRVIKKAPADNALFPEPI